MASARYYKKKRNEKEKEIGGYKDDIGELKKIYNELIESMDDEIRDINRERNNAKDELMVAVRHNYKFSACVDTITFDNEKAVTADSFLRITTDEIEEEISRLEGLKKKAEDDYEYYDNKYEVARNAERQEFIDGCKDAIDKIF